MYNMVHSHKQKYNKMTRYRVTSIKTKWHLIAKFDDSVNIRGSYNEELGVRH